MFFLADQFICAGKLYQMFRSCCSLARSSQGSTTPQKFVAVDQERPTRYTLNRCLVQVFIQYIVISQNPIWSIASTFKMPYRPALVDNLTGRWFVNRLHWRTTLMCSTLPVWCQCMYCLLRMVKWRREYSWPHGRTFQLIMKFKQPYLM